MLILGIQRVSVQLGALVCVVIGGCLPPSPSGRVSNPTRASTHVSRAEIEANGDRFATAYEIVRSLRPAMLVARDRALNVQSTSTARQARPGIQVYLDGVPFGGVEWLTFIPASTVLDVTWLSALDATTRYGTGHSAGAILVTSRVGRR